jgi:hypothetical protein
MRQYTVPLSPESLLDASSERVSLSLSDESAIEDLTDWINNDVPTRADLTCVRGQAVCSKAVNVLSSFGVPHKFVTNGTSGKDVTLIYDRVVARDCNEFMNANKNSRFIFGCAVSANMLHMVSDHQQFIKPNLVGLHDASRGMQQYNNIYGANSNTDFLQ